MNQCMIRMTCRVPCMYTTCMYQKCFRYRYYLEGTKSVLFPSSLLHPSHFLLPGLDTEILCILDTGRLPLKGVEVRI